MKTSEILRTAKALLDAPEKWCQHVCGRDIAGGVIGPDDFNEGQALHAVSRCSLSALLTAQPFPRPTSAMHALAFAATGAMEDQRWETIIWNNAVDRTHADVMAAFDRAIAAEEVKEAQDARLVFPSEWVEKRTEVPA